MKSVLDYCVVTRESKLSKIFVQEALRNRREMMRCPECGGRVKPHDAYKPDSPRQHFEHFPPTQETAAEAWGQSDTLKRPSVSKAIGYSGRRIESVTRP